MKLRPDLAGLALAALAAVLLTVLAVAGVPAPAFLTELGLVALGIGGGALLPRGAAAPAPAPAPAPSRSYPPARYAGDETGIFSRIDP